MKPSLSVIICTRDRSQSLYRALQSLTQCTVPEHLFWQVVVVDNGSSDDTQCVIARFAERLPLKVVVESTAGLSAARNTGVREAEGDWLVWIDDDVIVARNWLAAYSDAIESHPADQVMGGAIIPRLLGDPAPWLMSGIEFVQDAFAARPLTLAVGEIHSRTLPYGANFALKRETAQQFSFDTSLGRHPDAPLRGEEELSVMRKVLAAGGTGHWVPRAKVEHCIEPGRQSEAYLNAYFQQSGLAAAQRFAHQTALKRLERFTNSLARWLGHRLEFALYRGDVNRARRAKNLYESAWHWGYLCGALGSGRQHRSPGASS